MKRRRAVVDVGSIGGKRSCCKSSKNEDLEHLEKQALAESSTYCSSRKLKKRKNDPGKVYMHA
jgi:hypothetical protein